jgi:hypothetical protein
MTTPTTSIKTRIETVIALGVLMSMLLGLVLWGLKLDTNIVAMHNIVLVQESRLARIEALNERGISPIAEERILTVRADLLHLRNELESFQRDHDMRFVPADHLQSDIEAIKEKISALEKELRTRK